MQMIQNTFTIILNMTDKQADMYCTVPSDLQNLLTVKLPEDLVSNIINKEAYRKPIKASRKPPGCYKNFRAEIQK